MKKMHRFHSSGLLNLICMGFFLIFVGVLGVGSRNCSAETENRRLTIDLQSEDRDVGLRRMQILEKSLSPELIQKKRDLARMLEDDYSRKIGDLVQRLTTSIGRNTIITNVNINFFDPGFEKEIEASQDVSVSILLDQDGFSKWARGKASEMAAMDEMKSLIHRTFRIPEERITILVTPN